MTPGARLGTGAVIGGVIGAMGAGPVGAAIGLAAGAWLARLTSSAPTAAQKNAHAAAMQSTASPEQLRAMATKLDAVGLGSPLRARAALREQPPGTRRVSLQSAATTKDHEAADAAARTFKQAGAVATAEMLRNYARGLRALEASHGPMVRETIVVEQRRRS